MNRELAIGAVLLVAGLLGYVLGIFYPYTGRAFSVTAVMIGLLLVVAGRATDRGIEA